MSKVAITGNASGTGTFTIASPNSNSDRTLNLPDASGTMVVTGSTELTPPGTVIWYAANAAPTGYLKANGAAVSRTTYAALFTAIGTTFGAGDGSTTFLLPDLRGEFARGWDDGRGVDSGRAFGTAQTDAFRKHNHSIKGSTSSSTGGTEDGFTRGSSGFDGNFRTGDAYVNGSSVYESGTLVTATETRPRNIALLACIKF